MFNFLKKIFSESGAGERPSDPAEHREADKTGNSDSEFVPESMTGPWVGVDLDGTLAVWDNRSSLDRIGPPIPSMLSYVQSMKNNGVRVKIFTARAGDFDQIPKIEKWLAKNGLAGLEITNVKDYYMERLYDDRAIQVEQNTGRIITKLN